MPWIRRGASLGVTATVTRKLAAAAAAVAFLSPPSSVACEPLPGVRAVCPIAMTRTSSSSTEVLWMSASLMAFDFSSVPMALIL